MRWDENYDGYDGRVAMIQGGGHHNSSLKQDVEVLKSVFLLMMYGNQPPLVDAKENVCTTSMCIGGCVTEGCRGGANLFRREETQGSHH
jgi:hypothetical protein